VSVLEIMGFSVWIPIVATFPFSKTSWRVNDPPALDVYFCVARPTEQRVILIVV
jgi:hypothetical protein